MRTTGNEIYIHLNNTTLCYNDLGEGEIPLIFIHGFPFDKSSWKPQMDYFKTKHRVISYDIRGFGNSEIGKEEFSMRLFADDLIKLMDGLGIAQAIVCGLSMGGYILMNAAYRYADRFIAFVLSDTQCIADSLQMRKKRANRIAQIKLEGLTKFTDAFMESIFSKETLNTKKELVEKTRNTILSTSPIAIAGALNAIAQRYQMCPSLKEITVPTLILCGNEDRIIPIEQSETIQKSINNSTMKRIQNAGHLSNSEQPDEFNIQLEEFISSLH